MFVIFLTYCRRACSTALVLEVLCGRRRRCFGIGAASWCRLPKGFHFRAGEVYLRREGDSVLLSQRPLDWSGFLGEELAVSDRFMESLPESLVDVS